MDALVADPETRIDGFICPGHVSVIIGSAPYEPIAKDRQVPCVVTGFEAEDILVAIRMLLLQIQDKRSEVEIQYSRAVTRDGNASAKAMLDRVFDVTDASWRGIGSIPTTGYALRQEFVGHDARMRIPIEPPQGTDLPKGCSCGLVMRGLKIPTECPLFGKACEPRHPVGPCMVSSEGACAAYYKYREVPVS